MLLVLQTAAERVLLLIFLKPGEKPGDPQDSGLPSTSQSYPNASTNSSFLSSECNIITRITQQKQISHHLEP